MAATPARVRGRWWRTPPTTAGHPDNVWLRFYESPAAEAADHPAAYLFSGCTEWKAT